MTRLELTWALGRVTLQPLVQFVARVRVYGANRMPAEGGLVVAANHFSWIDPPALGAASPRPVLYMAKIEAHRVPGLGELLRSFGAFPVRRGESDRDAVREMRRIVAEGNVLGMFVEGTRQRSGVPGRAQPGAAMVAINEGVPVLPAAIHGSQTWRPGNFAPVTVAWGEPMSFHGLPRGGRGYKEASLEIERKLRELWEWEVDLHAIGRPRDATPPR